MRTIITIATTISLNTMLIAIDSRRLCRRRSRIIRIKYCSLKQRLILADIVIAVIIKLDIDLILGFWTQDQRPDVV